jgi:hypothetical protein
MIAGIVRDCWYSAWLLASSVIGNMCCYWNRALSPSCIVVASCAVASCAVASSEFTILMCWIGEGIIVRSGTESSLLRVVGCLALRSDRFRLDVFRGLIIIKGNVGVMFITIMRWYLICWSHLIEIDIKIDEYRWFMMHIARSEVFFGNKNCMWEKIFGGVILQF